MRTLKRKSKSQQLEEDYKELKALSEVPQRNTIQWDLKDSLEESIKLTNPQAYQAFKLLSETEVAACNYKPAAIRQALILKGNQVAEIKLAKLLNEAFKIGKVYVNEYITATLQKFYDQLNIRTIKGTVLVAYPIQLTDAGRFEAQPDKIKDSEGVWKHGYRIIRRQFDLQVAA